MHFTPLFAALLLAASTTTASPIHKRAKLDIQIVSKKLTTTDPFACSAAQVKSIENAVSEVILLALAGEIALLQAGVASTPLFQELYGTANPTSVDRNHFEAIATNLGSVTEVGDRTKIPAGIIIMDCEEKDLTVPGGSKVLAETSDKGNSIAFRPHAFTLDANRRTQSALTLAATLFHELQHLSSITGAGAVCDDVQIGGQPAYLLAQCKALSNADKVKNAQNHMFWAVAHSTPCPLIAVPAAKPPPPGPAPLPPTPQGGGVSSRPQTGVAVNPAAGTSSRPATGAQARPPTGASSSKPPGSGAAASKPATKGSTVVKGKGKRGILSGLFGGSKGGSTSTKEQRLCTTLTDFTPPFQDVIRK